MKLSKISLGVAAVIGVMSAPAHALLASAYDNTGEFDGATQNIRMSGATAQDVGILASTLRLCTAGSMTAYTISNNAVFYCTIDTTKLTPRTGATKLALYKYSAGGSGNGVAPVNNASNIPFLDLTKLATACTAGSATADADGTATNLSTYQVFSCTASSSNVTTSTAPYIGVSDVEPEFFGAASTYSNLNAVGLATVIFGVPVTKAAYDQLQVVQGLMTADELANRATVANTSCAHADKSLTESCMPSLSQGQVTSLYTKTGVSWNALTGITLGTDAAYVARRVSTSGTQKTYEAVIGRTANSTSTATRSCQYNVDAFVSGGNDADNTSANANCISTRYVRNGSGTNQVIACLNMHQSGGRGAVGVLTTEVKPTFADSYRFVKINGYAPTHANVAGGKYTQYSDASLNTRVGTANGFVGTAAAAGYSDFLTAFKAEFADPANIAIINGGTQAFGASGLMALDALKSPIPPADYTGATGRNPWSRLVGGTTLNNCQAGKAAAL